MRSTKARPAPHRTSPDRTRSIRTTCSKESAIPRRSRRFRPERRSPQAASPGAESSSAPFGRPRAPRHSDSDLVNAPAHGKRNHSVDLHQCKQPARARRAIPRNSLRLAKAITGIQDCPRAAQRRPQVQVRERGQLSESYSPTIARRAPEDAYATGDSVRQTDTHKLHPTARCAIPERTWRRPQPETQSVREG